MSSSITTPRDERGASALEYGLLVAGIGLVVLLAVFVFGEAVAALFQNAADVVGAILT